MRTRAKRQQLPTAHIPHPNRTVMMVSPDELKPYVRNARTHSRKQVEQIAACMRLTGFVGSILAQADGTIIAGHGRLEAAKSLGLKEVPVTYLDHLDEPAIRMLRIADNRLAEKAGWSAELLRLEFADLAELELDFDVTITGFENAEIDLLMDARTQEAEPAAESVPELQAQAISVPGDIWQLGPHRLMCGSMLDLPAVEILVGGAAVAMAFTDPPYNVRVDGHVCGLGKVQHREFAMASGEMSSGEFTHFLTDALGNHALSLADGAILFTCMDWRHYPELAAAGSANNLELLNLCVWNWRRRAAAERLRSLSICS